MKSSPGAVSICSCSLIVGVIVRPPLLFDYGIVPHFNFFGVFVMKKGFISGVLVTLIFCAMVASATATSGTFMKELLYRDIKVSLNGDILDLKDANGESVEPFVVNGTNYVPVRAISQILGLDVAWDGKNSTVVLTTPQEKKPTYITRTGKRYHNDPNCNGGTYWEVPFASAVGMGLTPCDKCVN